MTKFLQARVDEERLKKVNRIQEATGLSVSQLFRRLIDAAEVEPLKVTVNLGKANSDDTQQGKFVAVAA